MTASNLLRDAVNGFDKKLEDMVVNAPPVDTTSMEKMIRKKLLDIEIMIITQPRHVIKKWQILLFPEQDAKTFYKIVFGRWFMWLTIIVCCHLLFNGANIILTIINR